MAVGDRRPPPGTAVWSVRRGACSTLAMSGAKSNELRTWTAIGVVGLLSWGLWRLAVVISQATPQVFAQADRLAFAAVVTLGAIVVVGGALRVGRASPRSIGLAAPWKGVAGAAWAAIPAAVGLIGAVTLGWAEVVVLAPAGEALLKLTALIALVFLSEALPEELIFRGYIQSRLMGLTGPWGGVLLQAAIFTLFAHLIGAASAPMQLGFIGGFGVALGMLRATTGSVWASIGFHLAFIAVQQGVGGGWALVSLGMTATIQLVLAMAPISVIIAVLFERVGRARAGR